MTRLRQRIAERLIQAQSSAALLTTFNEVDLSAIQQLRARYKDAFEKQHGVKLGFMGFFVRASIEALKKFPVINASVEGSDIVYHEYYDIGVAVSGTRGLVVPVLRDADTLSMGDIEKRIAECDTEIHSHVRHSEAAQRIQALAGVAEAARRQPRVGRQPFLKIVVEAVLRLARLQVEKTEHEAAG